MKIIAVIPARYQASRFPGKLMEVLGDKTVIARTYLQTQNTNLFDDVFVVTDSDLIYKEIKSIGGKVIKSQKEHETGSDRIAEVVESLDCDIVLNVQGDEPFVNQKLLQNLLNVFYADEKREISVASLMLLLKNPNEIQNPNNVKVIIDSKDFALYFSRLPIPYARNNDFTANYYKHIGVYAFRKEALLQFSQLPMRVNERAEKIEAIRYLEYGMKIKMLETDQIGFGIDTPEDLQQARVFLKSKDES